MIYGELVQLSSEYFYSIMNTDWDRIFNFPKILTFHKTLHLQRRNVPTRLQKQTVGILHTIGYRNMEFSKLIFQVIKWKMTWIWTLFPLKWSSAKTCRRLFLLFCISIIPLYWRILPIFWPPNDEKLSISRLATHRIDVPFVGLPH